MSMRKQLVQTVSRLLTQDERVVLLLGDIGVFGFRDAFEAFGERVYNVGILEQATVSMAAGLAKTGLIPIIHTIAPFLVERCLEQIKVDFGYQGLGGNFISVGASYDYAALGCTHHCPADVQVMSSIPGIEVLLPGSAGEFDRLLSKTYNSGRPAYFRLSEVENAETIDAEYGRAAVVREGRAATVIAVGPMLRPVLEAARDKDVTVLYYNAVIPFDTDTLRRHAASRKILICEPYYRGVLTTDVMSALWPNPVLVRNVGIPRHFLTNYGSVKEHDVALNLTPDGIRGELEKLIDA